jgi:hypothetical protein
MNARDKERISISMMTLQLFHGCPCSLHCGKVRRQAWRRGGSVFIATTTTASPPPLGGLRDNERDPHDADNK